ncbi:MAG TPA: hypothetical protein VHU87_11675 [Rhizomicrobium sp.]|nr:hypothetical protein [Rhizomicrobium sp.]
MRILTAALLGAIAMFIWSAIAHMATPLATIGFQPLAHEQAVVAAMQPAATDKPGLYIMPWVDPKDPQMMQKTASLMKTEGAGIFVYAPPHAPGGDPTNMAPMLVVEFVKQLVQCLIAAYLVSMMMGTTFLGRAAAVTLIGISGAIVTNVSYWNWYRFPLNYTLAQITIEVVAAVVAGIAIAWWLGRRTA